MSLDRLTDQGIVVFPKLFSHDQLSTIRARVSQLANTYEEWIVHHSSTSGYFVSYSPLVAAKRRVTERISPLMDALVPPLAAYWCRHLLGRGWFTERVVLDAKRAGPQPLTGWHADQFPRHGRCLKTMLYLTDTTATNGAFSYVPGSHTWVRSLTQDTKDNRTIHTYEDLMTTPQHKSQLVKTIQQHIGSSYESDDHYSIDGPAGTLIVFDANGLHRGGTVRTGDRWLIRAHHRNLQWGKVLSSKVEFGTFLQRCWWEYL